MIAVVSNITGDSVETLADGTLLVSCGSCDFTKRTVLGTQRAYGILLDHTFTCQAFL